MIESLPQLGTLTDRLPAFHAAGPDHLERRFHVRIVELVLELLPKDMADCLILHDLIPVALASLGGRQGNTGGSCVERGRAGGLVGNRPSLLYFLKGRSLSRRHLWFYPGIDLSPIIQ